MAVGIGYGKSILFGEHFVVYGIPAIGIGLMKKAEVEVIKSPNMSIESKDIRDKNVFLQAFEEIKKGMGVKDNFRVKINAGIPLSAGMGSSAAICVGFARALANEYKTRFKSEQIAAFAYQGEKVFHGNPSGIDNTLAAFGGTILFQKRPFWLGGDIIRHLKVKKPFWIVIGNTGKRMGSTKELVAGVKSLKQKNEEIFAYLFVLERKLIERAIKALERGDLEELGQLMNMNHGLLSALGVSTLDNAKIVYMARKAGALGAKLTGAGGGGCCIALAKDEKHAKAVADAIKREGFDAFCSKVGE